MSNKNRYKVEMYTYLTLLNNSYAIITVDSNGFNEIEYINVTNLEIFLRIGYMYFKG